MEHGIREEMQDAQSAFEKGNFELAYSRYMRLADKGQSECQAFLGWMLVEGVGCAKDEVEAASWFKKAAEFGNPLGSFYFARWLTKQGLHDQAFPLYRSAAAAGYLPAIFRTGYSLARGKGVKSNVEQAYLALKTAASHGHMFALRELAVQDWNGNRGEFWRLAAPIEFVTAVVAGTALSLFNKNSDRLRG